MFAGQPEWQYFASADYAIPLDRHGTIKVGGSVNWQSSYFSDTLNSAQYRIGARHFVNAFVSFESADRHWDLTLTARNIGDEYYFSTLTPIGAAIKAGPYAGTLLLQGPQNPPRTIFFKIGYKY